MNVETIREYVLQKENVTEGFPFDEETLVIKVKNKMFLLLSLDETPLRFNVKCQPDKAKTAITITTNNETIFPPGIKSALTTNRSGIKIISETKANKM